MSKQLTVSCLALLAIVCGLCTTGCSHEEHPMAPAATKAEMMQATVAKAKQFLDKLEDTPPDRRNTMAKSPRMAETLRIASSDPATKKRMTELGVDGQ